MSGDCVLVVNAGSTSLKLSLVDGNEQSEPLASIDAAQAERLQAVAHRVVHGGPRFRDPVPIDSSTLEQIFELEQLAPLHNEPALRGIEQAQSALPGVPQVAVFDTCFHQTIPEHAATYALPARWREQWGVRRYGFHGLSVQWSAQRAPQLLAEAARGSGAPQASVRAASSQAARDDRRLVVCHLGGGCSVTAVRAGRSVDTTMGFSPLEGVPMATRSGSVDPGALLYAMREHGLSAAQLEQELERDSGLRGLAGGSGAMQEVEQAMARREPAARLAFEVFCHRTATAIGAMAVSAGGLDALVFTAGIGERSAAVREAVCERLAGLGVAIDRERNASATPDCDIAAPHSAVAVLVIRAREDVIAARAARALLGL